LELFGSKCRELVESSGVGFSFILIVEINEGFFLEKEFLSVKILKCRLIIDVEFVFPFLILGKFFLG